jgi:hypothetical protein
MIAHLQNGKFGKTRILDSLTVAEMHSTQFRHSPDINGFCLGFMEFDRNGQRVIAHGGDTFWFHSALALLPGQNTGIFISLNTSGGSPSDLAFAFIDHFFPATGNYSLDTIPLSKQDFRQFEGYYRSVRFPHSDLTRLVAIMNTGQVKYENGCLVTVMMSKKTSWLRTGELSFIEQNGKDKLEFRKNDKGNIKFMFLNSLPFSGIEKVPVTESPAFQLGIIIITFLVFLFTILYWPVAWAIRKKYLQNQTDLSVLQFGMKLILWISCFIVFVYLLCLMTIISDPVGIVFGIPGSLKIIQAMPVINLILIIGTLYYNIGVWKNKDYFFVSKIHYSLVTISLIIFEVQLYQWNLLGWNF